MTDIQLAQAQAARENRLLEEEIDRRLDVILSADDVGPDARAHLRGLLSHYAKSPHPFRECVRDNLKRFGPGRTEKVCATLKDMIRGTTRWRNDSGIVASATPEITAEIEAVLLSIPEDALDRIVMEVSR